MKFEHLQGKKIGDIIIDCVPEQFQHFFVKVDDNFVADNKWWAFELELDDEDSIGTHVWNLLPLTVEQLSWMPDCDESFTEALWKAVGDQCLTWVYG